MNELSNKTVVVTGALGALGQAVCETAESQGAKVIRLDVVPSKNNTESIVVDLADLSKVRQCFDQLGNIDGVVNLAGGFAMGDETWCESDEQWDQMFKLNVQTLRNTVKAAVPSLLKQQAGSIVNVGAQGAHAGQGLMSAYCASKSVVMRLTESLSEELKASGINVNAVLPSVIDTPANRAAMPDADSAAWVSTNDLANVICFLLSPAAKAVHGALIPVRGLS